MPDVARADYARFVAARAEELAEPSLRIQLAIADTDTHWLQFSGNLGVHEPGYLGGANLIAKQGTLAWPGATETLAHALARASECIGDFTATDHLAMADRPLADVRAAFGVPARQR